MQVEVWKMSGSSGFHFGRHGLGQEETSVTMSSDSLFAALVSRLAANEGAEAVDAFMKPFQENAAPFALSSTFPYAKDVLFFPVPFAAVGATAKEENAKQYKRVQYVSENLFRRLLAGESLKSIYTEANKVSDSILADVSEKDKLPDGIKAGNPIWMLETRPRVTLGRAAQNSSIYFTGRVTYAKDCGLWFGMYWRDGSEKTRMQNLFAELGESGLGAERSVGFGNCKIELKGQLELPDALNHSWVSLSRYLPREDETRALTNGAYKIVNIGGWLDSPVKRGQRRRAVNMLEEGATLAPLANNPIPGMVADVRPLYGNKDPLGHAVYRSGLALAVAWKGAKA
jgi:CRISPR-associated protein Csm4